MRQTRNQELPLPLPSALTMNFRRRSFSRYLKYEFVVNNRFVENSSEQAHRMQRCHRDSESKVILWLKQGDRTTDPVKVKDCYNESGNLRTSDFAD